jgi:hypothetical protein
VTSNPSLNSGQPQIAVNPEHPNDLVFLSTNDDAAANAPITDLTVFQCYLAYSTDGGVRWNSVVLPLGDAAGCGNPSLGVDSHGIFYVAFNQLGGTAPQVPGVIRSLDGGRTWSDPVSTPLQFGASPRLIVDSATDDVYVESSSATPVGSLQGVTVSKDHGLTWSPQEPLPAQSASLGNQIAVHDGVLASATGSLVPNVAAVADQGTTDPIPWVAADPAHLGRFAVMVPAGNDLDVYITDDSGRRWTGPAVITAPNAFKPWIEFGPTGLLGVVWRTASSVTPGGRPAAGQSERRARRAAHRRR